MTLRDHITIILEVTAGCAIGTLIGWAIITIILEVAAGRTIGTLIGWAIGR
jgi:hypothetical protein